MTLLFSLYDNMLTSHNLTRVKNKSKDDIFLFVKYLIREIFLLIPKYLYLVCTRSSSSISVMGTASNPPSVTFFVSSKSALLSS